MLSMKRILFHCLCIALLFLSTSATDPDEDVEKSVPFFRIAGYLPDYRFGIDLNSTAILLDDLYIFSLSPQPQLGDMMFALCCLDKSHYEKARQAAVHAQITTGKEVKIWVTIGGGGRSAGFTKNPDAMIRVIQQLLADEKIYGVDFDCELFLTHQDFVDYYSLIINAAHILHKEGKYVSVAIHAGQTLTQEVYEAVDRINLMTYDMMGSSYHADFRIARDAVDKLIQSGCPTHKIFLGLPAYGRHRLRPGETKTFSELMDVELQRGRNIDELRFTSDVDDFVFDSATVVASKVQYAVKEGLGGVFFWELGQDKQHESAPSGILLTAASKQVAKTNFEREDMVDATGRTAKINDALEKKKDEL